MHIAMAVLLPKWVMRRYFKLRKEFHHKKFTFKEAQETLEDDSRIVSLFLSELKKAGWLITEPHPDDVRKRLYQLKYLEAIAKEIEKEL